jgi:hypothetical protein
MLPNPGRAGELSIDEISTTILGQPPVSSRVLKGVTLHSNSYDLGAISLSSDGVYAAFAGLAAPFNVSSGMKPTGLAPPANPFACTPQCYTGINRVIARISWDGSISTSTFIPASQFEGIVKGVCSVDGSSYFLVGNASDTCDGVTAKCPSIGYIQHGSSNLVNVFQAPNPVASGSTGNGAAINYGRSYVSCAVRDKKAYFLRNGQVSNTQIVGSVVDVINMASTAILADPISITTANYPAIALPADLMVGTSTATTALSPKQILVNRDQTSFWASFFFTKNGPGAAAPLDRGGIYVGATTKGMTQLLATPASYLVTGMTLSTDERTLYFITRGLNAGLPANNLYSVSAQPCGGTGCTPALLTSAGAGFEYRGISLAPQAPPSPNPYATASPTPTVSVTVSATPSNSPSNSPSNLVSVSPTPTPSRTPSATMPSPSSAAVLPEPVAVDQDSVIVSYVKKQCNSTSGVCAELTNSSFKLYAIPINTTATGRWAPQAQEVDTGVWVSGNDVTQGSLSSCADYSCVTFGGFVSSDGEAPSTTRPHFPGDRIVGRMQAASASSSSPFTLSTKTLTTTQYDGIIKGVCAKNSEGYFIVGNSTTAYVAFLSEATSAISILGDVSSFNTNVSDIGNTACAVSFSGALYTGGVRKGPGAAGGGGGGGLPVIAGYVTSDKYDTTALGLTIPTIPTTLTAPTFSTRGFVVRSIAMNLNETRTWVCGYLSPNDFGIYFISNSPPAAPVNIVRTVGGAAAGTSYDCQGMVLSNDESMLIFVAKLRGAPANLGKSGLFTISTNCITATMGTGAPIPACVISERLRTQVDIPPEVDVRGIARAPRSVLAVRPTPSNTPRPSPTSSATSSITPTPSLSFGASPSPSQAPCPLNNYINTTTGLCTICPAGTFNANLGARQCTVCPSGSNSIPGQNCTSCPAGQVARPGQSGCALCPPMTLSLAGYGVCGDCPSTNINFFADPLYTTDGGRTTCPMREGFFYSEVLAPNVVGGPPARRAGGKISPCPPGSSNPVNGSIAGCICAAANSKWIDGGLVRVGNNLEQGFSCRCDISQGWSSLGLTEGANLNCRQPSTSCPVGSYITGPADFDHDIECSLCSTCGAGSVVVSACTSTSNTVCSPCTGNTYSMVDVNGNDAAVCESCTVGSTADLVRGGCVCNAANSTWKADNTCACAEGFTSGGTSGANLVCTFQQAPSPTSSITPTGSITPTKSVTPTVSESPTVSPTRSETPTSTPISQTPTPTGSLSFGATPSNTPTISVTSSITPTGTPSTTPSAASATPTSTQTPSSSVTPTISFTPANSASPTPSTTPPITPSNSVSSTISVSPTISVTSSRSPSVTGSKSASLTSSPSVGSKEALLGAAATGENTAAPTSITSTIGGAIGGVAVVLGLGIAYMHFTRNNKKRKLYGRKNVVSSSVVEEWKTGGVNPIGSNKMPKDDEPVITTDSKSTKKNRDRASRAAAQEERISFNPVAARDDAPSSAAVTSTEDVVVESTETETVAATSTWLQCNDSERSLTWYVSYESNETVWALPPGGVVTNVMEQ